MILDNFMKWGLKGGFKFVDDDPTIAKPAEVKMIGDKNVRAEVSTIFPSNKLSYTIKIKIVGFSLELVSKELNHFGVIAGIFRQIGGHSSRFVLFCSF